MTNYIMNNEIGATDLTMRVNHIESNNEVSPPKRPKIELPFASPSGSDYNAPVLEAVDPVVVPNFNLAEVAEEYLAICPPPVLQPEVEIGSSSLAQDCQPSTSSSMKAVPQTASSATEKPEEGHRSMVPPIGFKTARRCSKVSSNSFPNELRAKLQKTINAIKNSDGISKKPGRPKVVKPQDVRTIARPNPQPKKAGRRSSASVIITPALAKKLEAKYAANPNPASSDEHVMAQELNISTSDVKKWFTAHRREVGVQTHDSPDSGFSDAPGTSANAKNSQRVNRRIVETSGLDGTSALDADSHGQQDGIVQKTPDDKPGNVKLRFLREPEMRTNDLDVIKRDVKNVKKYPLDNFRALLDNNWEVKANRLMIVATATEEFLNKKTIYKESKRLNRIAAFVNVLSEEEQREVFKWRERFIDKKVEEGKYGDLVTVKSVIEETVIPWIAPFMYSRTTQQEGRNLTLEVALHDFSKLSDALTDATSNPIKWETPSLLQTDRPH